MNRFHFLSIFCLILGVVFLFLGFLNGEVDAGIFIIFPFVSGTGIYAFLGFVFIIVSIFLFLIGFFDFSQPGTDSSELKARKKTSFKGGGVVLIGPIPIVFASNWKIAVVLIILSLILIFVAFFSFRI
jgi:uncharacterized protein (TIGR00304 family)